jgi:hypothetical protein
MADEARIILTDQHTEASSTSMSLLGFIAD